MAAIREQRSQRMESPAAILWDSVDLGECNLAVFRSLLNLSAVLSIKSVVSGETVTAGMRFAL